MPQNLALTFGSRAVLVNRFITPHPDRQFILLAQHKQDNDGLVLLDVSGQPSLFKTDFSYTINHQGGAQDWLGSYNFSYFTLNPDNVGVFVERMQQLFDHVVPLGLRASYLLARQRDAYNYVLVTLWEDPDFYQLWQRAPIYRSVRHYARGEFFFHSANYVRVKPTAKAEVTQNTEQPYHHDHDQTTDFDHFTD